MPDVPGSISSQLAATAVAAGDRIPVDQESPAISASALVVGNSYRITAVGTTNWTAAGAGVSPAVGRVFECTAVGSGTGTAAQVRTRFATAAQIAALGGGGGGGGATDLSYNPTTRVVASSTGTDATLPLAGEVVGGAAVAGLLDAARSARLDQLEEVDSPTFAGLTVPGTSNLAHIHGALAGLVYEHVRNTSGASLSALTPYRVTGSQGDTDRVTIVAARADNAALMPASGILATALNNNADGHGAISGVMTGVNTAGLVSGQQLYVAPTGGLTPTRPASNIQPIAIVGRAHASTGTLVVLPGPVLALPAFTGAYGDLIGKPDLTVYLQRRELRQAVGAWSGGQQFSYIGSAPPGSAESAAAWTVRRTTQNTAGAIVATASATGAWSNYSSLNYS
jgi:hypothetical protein